ncbi:MAG: hypothetical protein RJR37_06295 [Peptococcaceae bacterium MAG4]|nr:hypothetical protein [Peptococcaceae bacterium MAG4]
MTNQRSIDTRQQPGTDCYFERIAAANELDSGWLTAEVVVLYGN